MRLRGILLKATNGRPVGVRVVLSCHVFIALRVTQMEGNRLHFDYLDLIFLRIKCENCNFV